MHALAAGEERLGLGAAGARKGWKDWVSRFGGKDAGDFRCLVELALPSTGNMQGYGHERPALAERVFQPRIGKCADGEFPEFRGEVDFPSVLQPVDEIECPGIPREGGAGERKLEAQTVAVRALERAIDRAIVHFPTCFAERSADQRKICVAGIAQRAPECSGNFADRAVTGKQQIRRVAEQFSEKIPVRWRGRHGWRAV